MQARKAGSLLLGAACAWVLAGAAPVEAGREVSDSTSLIVNPVTPGAASKPAEPAPASASAPSPNEASGAASSAVSVSSGPLGRLEVAWMLHPYARSAIEFLESINKKKSWNPLYRFRPSEMLESWEDMLRRHFKSVRRIGGLDDAPPGRFHLILNLDMHLKFGAVSGSITRVTVQAHIHRPDGVSVEHLRVVKEETVPYPAASNMMFEAWMGALSGMETDLTASAPLAAFARALP